LRQLPKEEALQKKAARKRKVACSDKKIAHGKSRIEMNRRATSSNSRESTLKNWELHRKLTPFYGLVEFLTLYRECSSERCLVKFQKKVK